VSARVERSPETTSQHIQLTGLIGELGSAFCSAAGKNLAAVLRRHSLTEAMLLLAMTLLGLIRTNHFVHLPFVVWYSTAVLSVLFGFESPLAHGGHDRSS